MAVKVQKYRPSLSGLMNLCDINYMLMLRLLADKEQVGESRSFFISDFLCYQLEVNEVTRYTSLITIRQDATVMGEHLTQWFSPMMVVRLYHDARMAEVVKSQDIGRIKPRYDYPNHQMHQPDEKQQTNQFLKEWLQLCHELGQSKVELFS